MNRKNICKYITLTVLLSFAFLAGSYIYQKELYNALYLFREDEPEQESEYNQAEKIYCRGLYLPGRKIYQSIFFQAGPDRSGLSMLSLQFEFPRYRTEYKTTYYKDQGTG